MDPVKYYLYYAVFYVPLLETERIRYWKSHDFDYIQWFMGCWLYNGCETLLNDNYPS